jgi:heterotetrameric sarcosine oxidase delta subunit
MFLIDCPNCGERNVDEFHWHGEVNPRPEDGEALSAAEFADYLYMRKNTPDVIREWWYHSAGCGEWFLAERHAKTHKIEKTYFADGRDPRDR